MGFSFETFIDALPYVLDGIWVTIGLTFASFAFALIFGFVWTFLRRVPNRPFNFIVTWIMEFIRSTPPIVQLFFIFYALPTLPVIGVSLPPFLCGVIGLGVHFSTYIGEIYRSGIESVDKGQWEASKALNFSTWDKWKKIVLPQAIPPTIPMLGNYFIIMFKEVPLASTITVAGIMSMARSYGSEHWSYVEPLTIVGIIFLVLSLPSAMLIKRLELKFNRRFDKNQIKKKGALT
ncbi:ectoine/hydroxyectoine ABC transporter permease subunit EhuD [Oceanobacillus sp. 1P07AA]|uniref:ectoine/hydroxyectoine ABC transporter permease subunit EhuD n=1 Tax=Oceanobacillus sp. 1P07AA TaxID=3132293 RepID=UPI0039A6D2C4